ncbi:hypothetical protein [Rhodococcus sp. 1139]|uniref:hypothetical protein n=1 Tax=Rhodococcus sp. 1139 TaxID=1833762 RepID=UPI00087203B1|nr:hypothetical protein [Rhodococcus sp. 1139]
MSTETTVAVIAAAIALLSMGAAFWQANQARRQTDLQLRALHDAAQPYVWVDIRPDERDASFFHLILKNEGPTVAENVHITIDPPLPPSWGESIGKDAIGPRQQHFSAIPPGRQMFWQLGLSHAIVAADTAKKFTVTINADGPYGPISPYTYQLDIDQYTHNHKYAPGSLSGITQAIEKLATAVEKK